MYETAWKLSPLRSICFFSGEGFQAASSLMVTGFHSSPFIPWWHGECWGTFVWSSDLCLGKSSNPIVLSLVSQYPNLDFLWVAKQIRNMKKPSKKPTIAEKNSKIFWDPMMTAITDSKMHFPHFDCLFSAGLAGVHHDVVHLCLLRPNGWFRGPQWRDPKWCHSSGQAASISIPSPSHLHPISINLPNSPGSLGSHPGLHDHPLHHDHIERLVGASAARGRLSIAGDRDAGLHHPLLGHLQPRYEGLPMDFGGIWGSLMELFRFLRSDPFPDASEMPISRCLERLKFDVSRSIYCPFFLGPHFISFCDLWEPLKSSQVNIRLPCENPMSRYFENARNSELGHWSHGADSLCFAQGAAG